MAQLFGIVPRVRASYRRLAVRNDSIEPSNKPALTERPLDTGRLCLTLNIGKDGEARPVAYLGSRMVLLR